MRHSVLMLGVTPFKLMIVALSGATTATFGRTISMGTSNVIRVDGGKATAEGA